MLKNVFFNYNVDVGNITYIVIMPYIKKYFAHVDIYTMAW